MRLTKSKEHADKATTAELSKQRLEKESSEATCQDLRNQLEECKRQLADSSALKNKTILPDPPLFDSVDGILLAMLSCSFGGLVFFCGFGRFRLGFCMVSFIRLRFWWCPNCDSTGFDSRRHPSPISLAVPPSRGQASCFMLHMFRKRIESADQSATTKHHRWDFNKVGTTPTICSISNISVIIVPWHLSAFCTVCRGSNDGPYR